MATPSSSSKSVSITLMISLFLVGTTLRCHRLNGQFAVLFAAINENGELYAARAAKVYHWSSAARIVRPV